VIFPAVLAVPAVIAEAILVEAVPTTLFVFALTAEVPAVIAAAIDVEAVVTFAAVAREPLESVASVRLRVANDHTCEAVRLVPLFASAIPVVPGVVSVDVATFQTSAAKVPNVVSERVPFAHTATGIVDARLEDAVSTTLFVLLLIVEIAVVNCEFVFALTADVPAVIAEARDDEALLN
jgi:hypothetical protein